jgi:hypothetical protein
VRECIAVVEGRETCVSKNVRYVAENVHIKTGPRVYQEDGRVAEEVGVVLPVEN